MDGFNGAMTFQSWNGRNCFACSVGSSGLQWGHDFSVMERSHVGCRDNSLQICFNGAMTFQSWKGRVANRKPNSERSFNGAMTFQSWKVRKYMIATSRHLMLQWGHDFSVMESVYRFARRRGARVLQWGHDFSVMERVVRRFR